VDTPSDLKIRQADSRDRWALASKFELALLLMIVIVATPYCLVLAFEASRADGLFIKLLSLVIIMVLVPLPAWRIFSTLFRQKWSCFWLAECDDRVVAIAKISRYHKHITFDRIKVKSKYRRQSVGSSIVEQILKKEGKPIYGYIPSKALKFFKNLGFEQIAKKQIPDSVKFEFNKFNFGEFFYIFYKNEIHETLDTINQTLDRAEEFTKNDYKARIANAKDINQIRVLVSSSFDLFLPFGSSSPAFRGIFLQSYLVLFVAALLVSISSELMITILLNFFYFSVLSLLVIFPVILFTSAYFGPKDFSKFWLLESDGKFIGYARVSKHCGFKSSQVFSVFQRLYITEPHRHPSVERILVERVLKYGRGSFYIAGSQERATWLTELGFEPILPEQFPPQYQFGAKVSASIKNVNLAVHKA
jgi:N-acetylglutamate synthase-like GNAT family acetyltransferase